MKYLYLKHTNHADFSPNSKHSFLGDAEGFVPFKDLPPPFFFTKG